MTEFSRSEIGDNRGEAAVATPARALAILAFWFGEPGEPGYLSRRREWFLKSEQFDEAIRERFCADYERVVAGQYESWRDGDDSCLAYVLLTDQFPRNMFRGEARAFATDAKALAAAELALARGYDQRYAPVQRMFFYLPFEHSENLDDQRRALALYAALAAFPETSDVIEWAERHYLIIERFGRFPHRNVPLGRPSTEEEIEFLKQPGSGF